MIFNKSLRGKTIATSEGKVVFNDEGYATELTDKQSDILSGVQGFIYVADNKTSQEAPKGTDKDKETEEVSEGEFDAEDIDLESMNTPELRELAKELDVKLSGSKKEGYVKQLSEALKKD